MKRIFPITLRPVPRSGICVRRFDLYQPIVEGIQSNDGRRPGQKSKNPADQELASLLESLVLWVTPACACIRKTRNNFRLARNPGVAQVEPVAHIKGDV